MSASASRRAGAGSSVFWLVPALCGFAVGFYSFAIAGVIVALIILAMPRSPATSERAEWMWRSGLYVM